MSSTRPADRIATYTTADSWTDTTPLQRSPTLYVVMDRAGYPIPGHAYEDRRRAELVRAVLDYAAGYACAWPGGYPLTAYTHDGAPLCHRCVADRLDDCLGDASDGWRIVAVDVHWEGRDEHCDHCYVAMPSAYGPTPDEIAEDSAEAEEADPCTSPA